MRLPPKNGRNIGKKQLGDKVSLEMCCVPWSYSLQQNIWIVNHSIYSEPANSNPIVFSSATYQPEHISKDDKGSKTHSHILALTDPYNMLFDNLDEQIIKTTWYKLLPSWSDKKRTAACSKILPFPRISCISFSFFPSTLSSWTLNFPSGQSRIATHL